MQGEEGVSALTEALVDMTKYFHLPRAGELVGTAGRELIVHFDWFAFSLFAGALVVFVISLRTETLKYQFKQLAWTCLALVIVCAQSNSFTFNILNGFFWFYVPATMVVGNDTLAYFGGFFMGKKIFRYWWGPKKGQRFQFFALSPNKTWEGFTTGALFTIVWGFYFSRYVITTPSLFNLWDPDIIACTQRDLHTFKYASEEVRAATYAKHNGHRCEYPEYMLDRDYAVPAFAGGVLQRAAAQLSALCGSGLGFAADGLTIRTLPIQWHFILIALFISLISPFGGFFASGLKRAYGIKDFDRWVLAPPPCTSLPQKGTPSLRLLARSPLLPSRHRPSSPSFLPGHGGLMDRLDCHLITGFMTRIHYMAFVVPFQTTIMNLLFGVAKLPTEQQHDFFNRLVSQLGRGEATGNAVCTNLLH